MPRGGDVDYSRLFRNYRFPHPIKVTHQKGKIIPHKAKYKYIQGTGILSKGGSVYHDGKFVDFDYAVCVGLIGLDKNHKNVGIETPDADIYYLDVLCIHGKTHAKCCILTNGDDSYILCNENGEPTPFSWNPDSLTFEDKPYITAANRKYRKQLKK
jgi:hypothetical protein